MGSDERDRGEVPEGAFWAIEVRDQIRVHEVDPAAVPGDDGGAAGRTQDGQYAPFLRVTTLRCPECDADRGWTAMGHWTDPARLICPVGHGWTPWPDDPDKGRSLMQELILAQGIESLRD
ncbi:hypothetical protein [Streptomyces sp. NPDC017993]|uniref:hypothetical protein n=1 Tax=Streptomyces sp. NPDC017993 TaxID=3365027 RepID=UPI0037A0650E